MRERPKLDGVNFNAIRQQHNDFLVEPFDELEVRDDVWDCGSEKSPGSDGLNFRFIKEFWDVIKSDFMRFLDEYKPISLIGCVYKIVAKLLSRLRKVLPAIIDERAFIEDRHLLHSVVIANEVIDEAKRCSKSCLVFKVDYEKTYDSVCWKFLLHMMRRMSFCTKWISWIEGYLKSISISILVNGSPTVEFIP